MEAEFNQLHERFGEPLQRVIEDRDDSDRVWRALKKLA
jgi:hypothetical protein